MFRNLRVLWAVVLAAQVCLVSGAALAEDVFRVPLMKKAPTIDGRIDAAEWTVSAGFDGLYSGGMIQQRRVQVYVGADETNIYVAVRSMLPTKGKLYADCIEDNKNVVGDDSAEVYINPVPDKTDQVMYQFLANSIGHGGYMIHTVGTGADNPGWKGNWKQASSQHDGWWEWEVAIPISSMSYVAKGRKTTDGVWMINACRNWKPDWGWSSLPVGGGYALAGLIFKFDPSAPAVQYSWASDPFILGAKGTLSVLNPTDQKLDLDAALFVTRNNMPEISQKKTLSLAAGETQQVTLEMPSSDPTTLFQLATTVKSADGNTVYYNRPTKWPKGEQVVYVGQGAQVKKPPMLLDIAYYPYKNKMRMAADITNMPKTAKLTKLTAVVRETASKKVIHTADMPVSGFKNGRQEIAFSLPPLSGSYEAVLRASGKDVPAKEIVKPFERTVYPWENNKMGTSDKVYPPFTPIQVQGNKLSTVLREHTLNNVGLLDQVMATSAVTHVTKPILSEPMRYVAKVDGKIAPIKAQPIKILSAKGNEARTQAQFSAGALKATSVGSWDYDGCLRVDLTLQPSAGKAIDELTLEIPFDHEAAQLIHANGDGLRSPIAQKIPAGPGVVWEGSKLACTDYIPNFAPYVFIGNAVRGLAWFAENDKGWGWDPKTPNVELIRNGEKTLLRVHLINKPTVIAKARTITFGLLAAPVKPRLSPNSPNWWRYRYARDKYTLLGTDINWLALGDCGSVYPAGKDMMIWEKLKKANTEHLTDAEVQGIIDRDVKYFKPYGDDMVKTFKAHANYNLRGRYGMKMVFYYNRASYQAADEFETFKDEWGLSDMRSVAKGTGRWEIKIIPTKSYIDHALYWYAKSFDIGGNRGVYWDNMFICASNNTEMTDAYKGADGKIVPAGGVWGLRELAKRTFVMENERGMLPITFPHMTSFNWLPVMSFATVQYDWEWKYSTGDVQDRHSREYIQLATSGELSGVWPEPLSDQGSQVNDPWIQRTFEGARLIHEMDNGPVPQSILDIIDQPGMKAYRYWDDIPVPIASGNPDVPTLVYSVPGKQAVVVIVSYSTKDENVTLSIDPKTLGFGSDYTVTDTENNVSVKVTQGKINFPLKKHDMRILKLEAG